MMNCSDNRITRASVIGTSCPQASGVEMLSKHCMEDPGSDDDVAFTSFGRPMISQCRDLDCQVCSKHHVRSRATRLGFIRSGHGLMPKDGKERWLAYPVVYPSIEVVVD